MQNAALLIARRTGVRRPGATLRMLPALLLAAAPWLVGRSTGSTSPLRSGVVTQRASAGLPAHGGTRSNTKILPGMVWIPGGEFVLGSDPAEIETQWSRYGWPAEWKRFTEG